MTGKAREWKGVTGGGTFGQKAMKITFSLLDVRFGYVILAIVVPFYMLFARKGYLAIYRYFRRRQGYAPAKSLLMTYRNHFVFGQIILDRFAVYAGQRHFRVDNDNSDLFAEILDASRGCIIAGSHVGNFELCGYLMRQDRKRINCLIFGGEAEEVQRNRMRAFGENNVCLVPVADDMSHIFILHEALSDGELVSMPCDRVFGSAKTVECDFLNGKADFPIGAFVLARQFDAPVVALFVMKVALSRYRVHVAEIAPSGLSAMNKREQIEAMTRAYAETLERIVRQYPTQWFNFYPFWKM